MLCISQIHTFFNSYGLFKFVFSKQNLDFFALILFPYKYLHTDKLYANFDIGNLNYIDFSREV